MKDLRIYANTRPKAPATYIVTKDHFGKTRNAGRDKREH